ncbi:hypothetical protein PD280_21540 [Virgibacillus salarius]|uniref:hypothetical protein n=1 Tax=Virgibacillus salarius TaxID=447199 RepID=UPI00249154FE|nr:hypothetical protein [Virgibacillus salarius]WBX80150.1 hypothetical protein PD280_21540 [Virgibacillus salarius]
MNLMFSKAEQHKRNIVRKTVYLISHYGSGWCWNCNKNIYEPNEKERTLFWEEGKPTEKYTTGITVEKAANELITGCPHCNRTYCD